jgi:hypothetical protein
MNEDRFEVWAPALFGWTVLGPYGESEARTVASRIPGSRVAPQRKCTVCDGAPAA